MHPHTKLGGVGGGGGRVGGVVVAVVGSIVIAVGVGLVPHVIRDGVSVLSAGAILALVVGLALGVEGARRMLRGRHLLGRLAGGAAILVVLAVVVSIVAPGVAATHVPASQIGSTPAAIGLGYESVTLRTSDEVQLAAWYLRGTNGAGVVVLHGAGSTRSNVLDQAAVLAEAGYALVLVDARGHGDSHGTAMDFGWFGDLDVAAATAHLAAQPEVDPERIGVVGFSMGGEEAIGAAAADPRIRAVVAEGATARRAADKAWFSDAYGWRGRLQEGVEHAQEMVTDLLTTASPPTPLRAAVRQASGTEFLLITAGTVADERRSAAYIRSGAVDRVAVWDVEGAGHTGGHDTRPAAWRRHVVDFLDENLG